MPHPKPHNSFPPLLFNSNYMKSVRSSSSMIMETNLSNPNVVDQDSHLSGAYIRNLVKQLTNSSSSTSSSSSSSSSPPPTPPKNNQKSQSTHKKQVRRRLHTTRPYQERLLNMAEARKEIVTALKFHRASMKQQQQHQQQLHQLAPPEQVVQVGVNDLPPCYVAPPPTFSLPSQTLGLNLNLDAACLYNSNNFFTDDSLSALSMASPLSVLPDNTASSEDAVLQVDDHQEMIVVVDDHNRSDDQRGLGSEGSRAVGDQEMEEIKWIGEMHEMEWNDTLNLATSAWWSNFLHNTESEDDSPRIDHHHHQLWEGGDNPFYSPDGYYEFPCSLKIEDTEVLDEEWLY